MITVNSDGVALSANYNSAVRSDSRDFLVKLIKNGAEIDCGIKRLTITKGSCGNTTQFTVGNLISSTLTAELQNLTDTLKGEEIEVRVGLFTGSDYEYVTMGFFTITEARKTIYSTSITGHGRIVAKTGGEFAEPSTAKTLARIGSQIGIEMGCQVIFDPLIDTTQEITAPMNGITTYQALQILASVVGGYAIDTHDGNVKICLFKTTGTLSVNSGMMTSLPDIEENNFRIVGVRCLVSEASYADGEEIPAVGYERGVVNLTMTNAYMTETLFDSMATSLINYSYRPATVNLSLGDPRIEGDDVLNVTDADGLVYTVPCHVLRHIYDGGFRSEIESVRATNEDDEIGTKTPFQRLISTISSGVVAAKAVAQKAKTIAADTAQYFWFTATGTDTGAHITEKPQEEFLNDPTNGGGNLLARSNGVTIRDGLTELSTWDKDEIRIGQDDGHHGYEKLNYHSMQMVDRDGSTYFHISDLRDETGIAEITDTFAGDGTTWSFSTSLRISEIKEITLNGVATSDYSIYYPQDIHFDPAPAAGTVIAVKYLTNDSETKAYTLGSRGTGPIGARSAVVGFGVASGWFSYAEGVNTTASGRVSHAEGWGTTASGVAAHAEGLNTKATGAQAHTEGEGTEASGTLSHAEGRNTKATGAYSHAEGNASRAENAFAHVEGNWCVASGQYSRAGGAGSRSEKEYTFSHGQNLYADSPHQASFGKFNVQNSGALFAIGKGTSTSTRSDALEVDTSGNLKIAGTLTQSSDRRIKDHIGYVGNEAVGFINNLKPAIFKKDEQKHLGFYAQDVEKIDEWGGCLVGELNGFKTLAYTDIIAPLVKYCQILEQRIETLERSK